MFHRGSDSVPPGPHAQASTSKVAPRQNQPFFSEQEAWRQRQQPRRRRRKRACRRRRIAWWCKQHPTVSTWRCVVPLCHAIIHHLSNIMICTQVAQPRVKCLMAGSAKANTICRVVHITSAQYGAIYGLSYSS